MDRLFDEIALAVNNGLYFLGLMGALAIPDMCAGLESEDGFTNGTKYAKWFDRWVAPSYDGLIIGEDAWGFRCSLVHQGRAHPHKGSYSRVFFVEPNPVITYAHRNVFDDALNLDIPTFCGDLIAGARAWLPTVEDSEIYKNNLAKFMTRHPNGIPPFMVGVPLIG